MELNKYIDHTLLKATTTPKEIKKLCSEAKEHNFFAVCVNSCYVKLAKDELKDSEVKIASVIGFPLGAMSTPAKVAEARQCIEDGADEIDMVINIGKLKAGLYKEVEREISQIKKAIGDAVLKVIIETCYLTDDEKVVASKASLNAGADFVKTSTGFGTAGATYSDISLMKNTVEDKMSIKASGGIKDRKTAERYIELGANRLGTSSGIKIVTSN
ncbi:deoxyribose-phosphate aldolase [Salegentibacter chungangensis]|uniref:Deoxyribose-phosphate aldolase n=1 Tax=Salegentibacter chungangensis TaxID=1335724 RepID=A0ABW3NU22_9FLAO